MVKHQSDPRIMIPNYQDTSHLSIDFIIFSQSNVNIQALRQMILRSGLVLASWRRVQQFTFRRKSCRDPLRTTLKEPSPFTEFFVTYKTYRAKSAQRMFQLSLSRHPQSLLHSSGYDLPSPLRSTTSPCNAVFTPIEPQDHHGSERHAKDRTENSNSDSLRFKQSKGDDDAHSLEQSANNSHTDPAKHA